MTLGEHAIQQSAGALQKPFWPLCTSLVWTSAQQALQWTYKLYDPAMKENPTCSNTCKWSAFQVVGAAEPASSSQLCICAAMSGAMMQGAYDVTLHVHAAAQSKLSQVLFVYKVSQAVCA